MLFDEEETEKIGQKLVSAEKYEQLKVFLNVKGTMKL